MLKAKLEEFIMRVLSALVTLVVRNPRTTACGIVGAFVIVGARRGLQLTPDQQEHLATVIVIFIGLVAGDHHRRKIR